MAVCILKPCISLIWSLRVSVISRCCLIVFRPLNSTVSTKISYMAPQPPLMSRTSTLFALGNFSCNIFCKVASELLVPWVVLLPDQTLENSWKFDWKVCYWVMFDLTALWKACSVFLIKRQFYATLIAWFLYKMILTEIHRAPLPLNTFCNIFSYVFVLINRSKLLCNSFDFIHTFDVSVYVCTMLRCLG